MTDAALVYSALVYAALHKSGLISNGDIFSIRYYKQLR